MLAQLLAKQKEIAKVCCTFYKTKPASPARKILFRPVDGSSFVSVFRLLSQEKADLVVNCSLPDYNRTILEACLQTRHHYLDLASYWEPTADPQAKAPYRVEQLEYHQQFRKKKLLAVIMAGVAPGLTNLLAKEAAEALDTVDSLKIRLLEECKTQEPYFAWSTLETLNLFKWKPLVWKDGLFQLRERFSEEEFFEFPKPYGRKKVWLVAQEEMGTIPLFLKVGSCDVKQHDHLEFARQITDETDVQHLLRRLSSAVTSNQEKELSKAVLGLVVEARGNKGRKQKTVRYSVIFPSQKEIKSRKLGANYITYPAALMASFFIRSIPQIKERGVFPPEALSREVRQFVLEELKKVKGVTVSGF